MGKKIDKTNGSASWVNNQDHSTGDFETIAKWAGSSPYSQLVMLAEEGTRSLGIRGEPISDISRVRRVYHFENNTIYIEKFFYPRSNGACSTKVQVYSQSRDRAEEFLRYVLDNTLEIKGEKQASESKYLLKELINQH